MAREEELLQQYEGVEIKCTGPQPCEHGAHILAIGGGTWLTRGELIERSLTDSLREDVEKYLLFDGIVEWKDPPSEKTTPPHHY